MVTAAGDLAGLVAVGATEAAAAGLASPHSGSIDGQADERGVVKGLMTLGLVEHQR
jgi:hypothetical protein